jgi:hypothetical protein
VSAGSGRPVEPGHCCDGTARVGVCRDRDAKSGPKTPTVFVVSAGTSAKTSAISALLSTGLYRPLPRMGPHLVEGHLERYAQLVRVLGEVRQQVTSLQGGNEADSKCLRVYVKVELAGDLKAGQG